MKNQLVSVIVPTKNSEQFLEKCLKSIKSQSYKDIEIIVVDNFSTDKTKVIAKEYASSIFNSPTERSTQRNFGAKKAHGQYLLFVDSDMELSKEVIEDCINLENEKNVTGIVIPEKSIGEGFWAECKALEKSFYVGVDWMEAARFYDKKTFLKVGGYDVKLISGEDFDLSQKVGNIGNIGRINKFILHNEGKLSLITTVKKKFYYSQYYARYAKKWKKDRKTTRQISLFQRYALFFSNPKKLMKHPLLFIGMLYMKNCEFFFGGLRYIMTIYFNL